MKKILVIAWRNVWRNKLRSSIVIGSIALGMWAGIFVMGLSLGMNTQRMEATMDTYVGHAQIHNPAYKNELRVSDTLGRLDALINYLDQDTLLEGYTTRVLTNAMISSPYGASGVKAMGVDTSLERRVTTIPSSVVDGAFLSGISRNPIYVGQKLADKLNVSVRNKVVLTLQDVNGEMVAASFRVAGVFRSGNSMYDESTLFVRQADLQRMLGIDGVHEVVLKLRDMEETSVWVSNLNDEFPVNLGETWKEVAPELAYADDVMEQSLYVVIMIIILALLFGIVNTMLMAVLERKKELGMLLAIGMNKTKVFAMIMMETLFFSLIGGPLGLAIAYLSIAHFAKAGIPLDMVGEGLESLGMSTTIYPELDSSYYLNVGIMVIVAAALAAIYPALRALRLNPSEAIRSI